jgi:GAF domain-containing protein
MDFRKAMSVTEINRVLHSILTGVATAAIRRRQFGQARMSGQLFSREHKELAAELQQVGQLLLPVGFFGVGLEHGDAAGRGVAVAGDAGQERGLRAFRLGVDPRAEPVEH